MSKLELELHLEALQSAEDFLEFFSIDYDQNIVQVNRLHILQRFHDYISQINDLPEDEDVLRKIYADLLKRAYEDFVNSNALTEKVFKVFHAHKLQNIFIPVSDLKIRS